MVPDCPDKRGLSVLEACDFTGKKCEHCGTLATSRKNLFFVFCTIIFKMLLTRTILSFLIQFQVERREMMSTFTVDLVSGLMNQNTAALTPKLDGNISYPGKLIF